MAESPMDNVPPGTGETSRGVAQEFSAPARATLTDVARLAGVSRQTASRVARGGDLVNARTAARVRRAITRLNYQPNPVARALSTGRGKVLGVLTHETSTYGAMSILSGISQAAAEMGYSVSIAQASSFDRRGVPDSVNRLAAQGCDGVILMAPWATDAVALRALQKISVPLVTTSEHPDFAGPAVHPNTVQAARDVVNHLLALGHATVRHVSGPRRWNATRLRADGWKQALEQAGAAVLPAIGGDWSARSGYDAGVKLANDDRTTAIFAANDETALGVIYALTERGLRVPEDISVVGYDDIPASPFFLPSLTTIRIDSLDHGRQAVNQLLLQLNGQPTAATTYVGHELIVRSSTAPARPTTT
jgi:DNA-binding LacI/PurR family transcriptional regulator